MKNSEKVLEDIEELSKKIFLPIVGRKKGSLLEKLIKKNKPKSILEIGTLVGYSAILMAKKLKSGKLTSIEINHEIAKIAKSNVEKSGLSKKIEILLGDALNIINKLNKKFDFVFIDAAKEEYVSYLKSLEKNKCLNKNCIIVADNAKIFADSMKDYLDYVRNSKNYKSKFYDFTEDGMEVSIKL